MAANAGGTDGWQWRLLSVRWRIQMVVGGMGHHLATGRSFLTRNPVFRSLIGTHVRKGGSRGSSVGGRIKIRRKKGPIDGPFSIVSSHTLQLFVVLFVGF